MSEAKQTGADAIVKAGGIAATKAKTDAATTGPLVAVAYRHPASPDRTWVRLFEESLRPAVDAEMKAMGFAPPTEATTVGKTRKRALGFPAAAVVQQPKKAHFALEVMRDFRRAATRARTKPGHANDAFLVIGKKLERSVPAFLPSFWEEVGRTFLAEEATGMASQSFERARTAERGYKLKVDEDERASAYLEFATAGAVPAKSLIGYATDLAKAFPAPEAARRFVKLNVQRIKAGLPPWTGMAKEIGKLATAAKLPKLEAEFLEEILGATSLKKAAPDFWATYRPILRELAKTPEAKAKLAMLFPLPRGFAKFLPTWLAFLEEIDAVSMLVAGPPEEAARFLAALTRFVTHDDADDLLPEAYYRFFDALAPGLARAGTPVDVTIDGNWDATYATDVLETALAHGLVLVPRPEDAGIDLRRELAKDPVRVAADPELAKLLDTSIGRVFGRPQFEACAKGKTGLVAARRRWLMSAIENLAGGALPRFGAEVEELTERTSAATFAEFPDAADALSKIDVGPALAQTLRGGIFDELTWPAFEETIAAFGTKSKIQMYGTTRHPIVRAGRKVVVFDGATRLKELDLPPAAKDPDQILFLDGDLFIEYDDAKTNEHLGMWASRPKSPFPLEQSYGSGIDDVAPVPGGGVSLGAAVLHAGDTPKKLDTKEFSSDGTTFWLGRTTWYERLKLTEFDPQSGKTGRPSWPAFVTDAAEKNDGLKLVEVVLLPITATSSPLGVVDGLTGHYKRASEDRSKFELVRVDGRRWEGKRTSVLFDWPGGVERALDIDTAYSRSDDDEITIMTTDGQTAKYGGDVDDDDREGLRTGAFTRLPRSAWFHYLEARDEAASKILRTVSVDIGRTLATAAMNEAGDDEAIDETIAAVKAALPGIDNASIQRGVAIVAKEAARLATMLETLREAQGPAEGVTDDDVKAALPQLPTSGYNDGFCTTDMARVAAAFRERKTGKLTESSVAWDECIEHLLKDACFAASRTKPDDKKRTALRALVDGIVASGLLGLTVTRATLQVATASPLLTRPKNKEMWLATVGDALWFVRMEDFDEDEPKQTINVFLQGRLVVPSDATVTKQATVTIPDDRAFAEQFWRELETRGPVAHDPTAAALVAAETALGLTEATLLLAGLPGLDKYDHDFLGKELRTTLGLKVTEAARAKEALEEMPDDKRAALVGGMANVAAADGYWKPASEEGSAAQSLIAAAKRILGKSVVIREELVALLKKSWGCSLSERRALTLLLTAGDTDNPLLELPKEKPDWLSCDSGDDAFGNDVIEATARLIPLLATHLPVGDEYRSALPVLYDRVRAILQQPDFIIELGSFYGDAKERTKLVAMVVGKPIEVIRGEQTWQGKDDGLVQMIWHGEDDAQVGLRTSALKTRRASLLPFLTLDADYFSADDTGRAALYLLSTECETLIERIRKTPVPDGAFELNPLVSAKKLVATVRDELGVDDDAAVLYLQILALPNPQQRQLLGTNGWTAAKFEAAAKALVKKKLFVEGKRERAGRSVFLPGAWEKKSSGVSVETYKLPFYDRVSFDEPMVTTAPHELYARAWKRWSSGDKPGFENVEKRKKN